ncbi:MAG: DUF4397 domain-containing protein [Bacteroidetes bacterium]|nr:DUF4397 domain-containing protein [Bacteroidota bacterium]
MNIKTLSKFLIVVIFAAAAVNYYGCNEENIINPVSSYGYISVYHTLAGGPNVDILINGSVVASDVAYLERINYQQLTSGNNSLQIVAGGTTVIDTTIFLAENNYYSVFVYNNNGIKPLIVKDDLTSPGNVNASVRFIHLAPVTPAVDIGADSKPSPWFPFYSYGQVSNFRPVTGGTYTLYMNLAGTSTNIAGLANQNLTANGIYTIIAKGVTGGTGSQALGLLVYQNQ